MTFNEVDQRYAELKLQFQAGAISEQEFDEALRALMIQDEQGRWWAKARETGQWNYYDPVMQNWVPATPPSSPAQPPRSAPQPSVDPSLGRQLDAPAPQGQVGVGFSSVQPELSPGLKIVFYVLSFLVPIVGIVLYFVYRNKPAQEDRSAANLFLILGLIAFALSCFCSIVPFLFAPVVNY
ncbi:MAG: hypothetical protein NZ553_08745 [Caldilinea sp.]|nr:hypothetical protein [Caldilinea sp.]MDW8440545.1 hypothetical protein [Caldilineaceae bacterium]